AGIVDLGRVLYTNVGVQEATQEGAMYAAFSVEGAYDSATDDPPITARILDAVDFPTIDPNLVTIAVDCSGGFMEIAVTVDHPVELITPIVGDFLGGNINLSRTIRAQAMLGECP